MKPPYFKPVQEAPAPLAHTTYRTSRFEEIDPLEVVWHGRYASYFEDARVAFGEHYRFGYQDFFEANIVAPIKQFYTDYHAPISFGQKVSIQARLHFTEAARLNFDYEIRSMEGSLLTTGFTIQLFWMLDTKTFSLYQPPFFEAFCTRWRKGEIL